MLDLCERLAAEKFAPFNRLVDTEEPWFDGEKVHLPQASHDAATAYADSGMLAAAQDHEFGGMQLPCVVEIAANAFFSHAGIGVGGGAMLTSGNANLLMAHGTPLQRDVFAKNEFAGPVRRHHVPERTAGRLEPVGHHHARAARWRRLRA